MNKKGFIQNGIILPASIGVALAILLACFMGVSLKDNLPIKQGAVVCRYDSSAEDEAESGNGELVKNALVGTLACGESKIPIRFNADYSLCADCLSMAEKSKGFGEAGCVRLRATAKQAELISGQDRLGVEASTGNFSYTVAEVKTFNNEYKVLTFSPRLPRSVVIYYQDSDGVGLSAQYKAFVLKEVE